MKTLKQLKNYRAFTIRYMPATNTKSSRISILDNRKNERRVIPYNYEFNSIYAIAQDFLESLGIDILGVSEVHNGYVLLTEDFKTSIKK